MKKVLFVLILILSSCTINISGEDIGTFRSAWAAKTVTECLQRGVGVTFCTCLAANIMTEVPGEMLRGFDKRDIENRLTAADREILKRVVDKCKMRE